MIPASPRVLVLSPAFNEVESVAAVVRSVTGLGYPTCVIDDGSSDDTAAAARAAGATVLRLPVNLGVGGALRCGFRFAVENGYDVAVQIDADGQHDPSVIPLLLERMRATGADMVVGSRFAAGPDGFPVNQGRRVAMRLLARRASHSVRRPITDATSGLRAIRRPLLEQFARDYPVEYLGDTVEAMVLAGRQGRHIEECPIEMSERAGGVRSAGTVASIWYVLRVLLAIELMRRRRRDAPPAMPSGEGAP